MSEEQKECQCHSPRNSKVTAVVDFLRTPLGKGLGLSVGGLFGLGAGMFLYGTLVEPRRYRVETVDITTGAPEFGAGSHDGEGNGNGRAKLEKKQLRILHLSDIHLHGGDEEKAQFLSQVTDDDFDIVVLTGDIFENFVGIRYVQSLLMRKPRIGAYAVLGNHDYFDYRLINKALGRIIKKMRHGPRRNVTPMIRALQEVGFTVLQNEKHAVPEHDLFVVGIDWPTIAEAELAKLMETASDDHFKLFLFHLPINLDRMARAGAHLAVGGHTHGGQVRIPGYGALITESDLGRSEAYGLIRRGRTAFHVSRGLGADPKTNIRLFCPPAATILNITHYESV